MKKRILINTNSFRGINPKYYLDFLKKNKLYKIELNLHELINNSISVKTLKKIITKNRISVKICSGGWCDFFQLDNKKNLISIDKQIKLIKKINCKNLRVFFGRKKKIDIKNKKVIKNNISELLQKYPDINFYFENESGVSCNPSFLKSIMSSLPFKNLKLNFDPINFEREGKNHISSLKECLKYIGHVHLKGFFYNKKKLTNFGNGDVDLKMMLKILYKKKYNGFFSLEYEGKKNKYDKTIESYNSLLNILKNI